MDHTREISLDLSPHVIIQALMHEAHLVNPVTPAML